MSQTIYKLKTNLHSPAMVSAEKCLQLKGREAAQRGGTGPGDISLVPVSVTCLDPGSIKALSLMMQLFP